MCKFAENSREMTKLSCFYFSATSTTRRCVEAVSDAIGLPVAYEINLADNLAAEFPLFGCQDVVIVAVPVYGGRVPLPVADALRRLKGEGCPAIAMVVYGNRDYDDALLELTDLLGDGGFRIIGAGAFIGQHSIFPKVATSRPDASDMKSLREFGKACKDVLLVDKADMGQIVVKGNRPYKKYSGVPLHPRCDSKKCVVCGRCAVACPVGAIDAADPTKTDPAKCLSCGRCIFVCNNNARGYSGVKYSLVGKMFVAGFSKRKEPEWKVAVSLK